MLSLEEQLAYTTVRIETKDALGNVYSGTGFFFNFELGQNQYEPVLVTNKHVVKNMVDGTFVLTERKNDDEMPNDGMYMHIKVINFESQWMMHPSQDVDLCVMPLKSLLTYAQIQHKKRFFYRSFGIAQLPKEEDYEKLNAISEVLMIGYPHGVWDSVNNRPIIRKGLTATDLKVDFQGRKEFVIDMSCIPGSSGSPVIVYNKGVIATRSGNFEFGSTQLFLLGVLYAGPTMNIEGNIVIKTIPTSLTNTPIVKSEIMINLGYCVKAQYLLDFASLLQQRNFK